MSTSSSSSSVTVTLVPDAPRPDEAASNPHHVLKHGAVKGFQNPYPSFLDRISSPWQALKKIAWPTLTGDLKFPDVSPPTVPVVAPRWRPSRTSSSSSTSAGTLRATWLGHACYYVEFPSGLRVLFDPVFEDRCSPLSFLGPKRYTPPPCAVADIPAVDAVVISHSHYDHLSHGSVRDVHRAHPAAHFFVGRGLEPWFRKSGLDNVTELDWWQDADLTVRPPARTDKAAEKDDGPVPAAEPISARISCLPCQHTSGRSGFDKDATLWCSWAVRSGGKSVWFGGDTGYRTVPEVPAGVDDFGPAYDALPRCPQFAQIGALRGPFDLGLIPIGAYAPRALFSHVHANPFDSVEIFRDTRCRRAMGIHWGTWALTCEKVLEPPSLLKEALRRRGIAEEGVFDVCDIGESREF